MAYTAIVLDEPSRNQIIGLIRDLNLTMGMNEPTIHAHHITLAMGAHPHRWNVGTPRKIRVVGFGEIEGRVSAFRVEWAEDSVNKMPHITAVVEKGCKPKESNEIRVWTPLPRPIFVQGSVQICE
jgi:hypothetical protein